VELEGSDSELKSVVAALYDEFERVRVVQHDRNERERAGEEEERDRGAGAMRGKSNEPRDEDTGHREHNGLEEARYGERRNAAIILMLRFTCVSTDVFAALPLVERH